MSDHSEGLMNTGRSVSTSINTETGNMNVLVTALYFDQSTQNWKSTALLLEIDSQKEKIFVLRKCDDLSGKVFDIGKSAQFVDEESYFTYNETSTELEPFPVSDFNAMRNL